MQQEIKKMIDGLIQERDITFANYHRLCGAVACLEELKQKLINKENEEKKSKDKTKIVNEKLNGSKENIQNACLS